MDGGVGTGMACGGRAQWDVGGVLLPCVVSLVCVPSACYWSLKREAAMEYRQQLTKLIL